MYACSSLKRYQKKIPWSKSDNMNENSPTSYVCLSGRSRSQCTLRRLSRWLTQARTQESLHLELYTVSISQLVLKLLGRTWVYNLW